MDTKNLACTFLNVFLVLVWNIIHVSCFRSYFDVTVVYWNPWHCFGNDSKSFDYLNLYTNISLYQTNMIENDYLHHKILKNGCQNQTNTSLWFVLLGSEAYQRSG